MVNLAAKTILIVDDQQFVRTIVRSMLAQMGVTSVLEASNGEDALRSVSEYHPHAVICDIQMRPTDGFTFVRKLREDQTTAKLPVIMLTAHADSATVSRGAGLDIDAFVSKPVLPTSLGQTLTQVLERREKSA